MEENNANKNRSLLFFLVLISFSFTAKADLIGTILSVGSILYGIAAGLAALMIVLHAVRWKTASGMQEREDAKKGIVNVVLGLALIAIAASVVSMIFIKPENITKRNITATTFSWTTTSSVSTTSSSQGSTTSSTSSSTVPTTTTTTLPISNGECNHAETGNLCTGIDFVYGAGTRTICCSAYGCCCNPVTPGTCKP